jgi:hypothetical protein
MLNDYLIKLNQFLQIDKYFFISLFFLLILTFIFFKEKREEFRKRYYSILLLLAILIFIAYSLFLTLGQYFIWQNHPLSKYLLPPHQSINYFFNYSYFHFWRDFFFRFLGMVSIFLLMKGLDFLFQRDIFYDDEKILIPYLSLFFFFPYNILFILIGFFVLLLIIGILILFKKMNFWDRYSFRNYWLLLCWFLFFFQPFILTNYQFLQYKP